MKHHRVSYRAMLALNFWQYRIIIWSSISLSTILKKFIKRERESPWENWSVARSVAGDLKHHQWSATWSSMIRLRSEGTSRGARSISTIQGLQGQVVFQRVCWKSRRRWRIDSDQGQAKETQTSQSDVDSCVGELRQRWFLHRRQRAQATLIPASVSSGDVDSCIDDGKLRWRFRNGESET